MNVPLTPDLEQFVQSQVESGKYTSPEEVMIAAIKILVTQESVGQNDTEQAAQSKTPEELGWPPGFFESTYGSCQDDPIVIDDEGTFEDREEIL